MHFHIQEVNINRKIILLGGISTCEAKGFMELINDSLLNLAKSIKVPLFEFLLQNVILDLFHVWAAGF